MRMDTGLGVVALGGWCIEVYRGISMGPNIRGLMNHWAVYICMYMHVRAWMKQGSLITCPRML